MRTSDVCRATEAVVKFRARQSGVSLVELLIGMTILTIITAMILSTWFVLQDSYSYSSTSTKQREFARDAMSRMVRELRDAQGSGTYPPIRSASARQVVFYTPFNDPGDKRQGNNLLTRYVYVYEDGAQTGSIYRQRDVDADGFYPNTGGIDPFDPADWDSDDRVTKLLGDVVNIAQGKPVFEYGYYNAEGLFVPGTHVDSPALTPVYTVNVRLVVDTNPGKSPTFFELASAAQIRNVRAM